MHNQDPRKVRRTKAVIAVSFATVGAALLILLAQIQTFPQVWLWVLFAITFVFFTWNSVEINDRLVVNPSVMVALAAGVVFGPGSATLGVAAMAGLGLFTPADIRERRWFQPMANFGQLVITYSVAIWVLEQFLPTEITAENMWRVLCGAACAAFVHGLVSFTIVSWVVRLVYGQSDVMPWSGMGINHASYFGMGLLGGLLGATYVMVGNVTLPLVFTAFFVGHMTFSSYAELREAQEATLRGFIKALEAKDLYTRGHTERVAHFSRLIGEELGFGATGLNRIRWAALIHDVGKLAVPRELIRKKSRLTDEEYALMQSHVHVVEDILAEVQFLHPVVEIASAHHLHYDGGGYAGPGHTVGDRPTQETCILAVADAFDAMTSSRSYRMAMTQQYAIEELRRNAGSQFDPEAVEALVRGLERTGERYGSQDLSSDEEARRIAEDMEGYRIYG
jgi:hypothetical protein